MIRFRPRARNTSPGGIANHSQQHETARQALDLARYLQGATWLFPDFDAFVSPVLSNRPEAERCMSNRPSRPMRPGRPYPRCSWGSPRAVSITLQPTSGGARFNRACLSLRISPTVRRGTFLAGPDCVIGRTGCCVSQWAARPTLRDGHYCTGPVIAPGLSCVALLHRSASRPVACRRRIPCGTLLPDPWRRGHRVGIAPALRSHGLHRGRCFFIMSAQFGMVTPAAGSRVPQTVRKRTVVRPVNCRDASKSLSFCRLPGGAPAIVFRTVDRRQGLEPGAVQGFLAGLTRPRGKRELDGLKHTRSA